MQGSTQRLRQGMVMLVIVLGVMGLGLNSATARELCNPNAQLGLADGNGDGVVSRGEIQAIIDAAQGVEGVDQLQSLLNSLPGDVTGIRYTGCTADGGDGSGNGDGGTGTGDGSGSGDGGGTGDGSGSGDGGGSGSGDGAGTGDGSSTGDDGAASGDGGTVVINAEGTPVNSITGLPDTGEGSGFQASAPAAVGTGLAIAAAVALLFGAFMLRGRTQVR